MQEISEHPQKTPDRRKSLRSPLIVLKVTDNTDRQTLFGYANEISKGGLFISSINPRDPGDQFMISFQIPDTEIKVECQCEVIWIRPYQSKVRQDSGYGVRFIDLAETISQSIDDWIQSQE